MNTVSKGSAHEILASRVNVCAFARCCIAWCNGTVKKEIFLLIACARRRKPQRELRSKMEVKLENKRKGGGNRKVKKKEVKIEGKKIKFYE